MDNFNHSAHYFCLSSQTKTPKNELIFRGFLCYKHLSGDSPGIRTQDPILKRDVLYLLS